MRTSEFVRLAQAGPVSYDEDRKAEFHAGAEVVLRRLVKLFGLKAGEYDLRHNQGGIAVSGEITLHTDTLYVKMYQSAVDGASGKDSGFILWRTCAGRKDYTGGSNHWSKWSELNKLGQLAAKMKAVLACGHRPT